jgi:flavodoxin
MHSLVIYASRSGNTRRVAEAIANRLGERGSVDLRSVDDAPTEIEPDIDLLVIGGPTEAHGMTPPVAEFFDRLQPKALAGRRAVGFDTRLRWPEWLSGSASARITDRLRGLGAKVVVPEQSFFVTRKPELEAGELERASSWAASLPA